MKKLVCMAAIAVLGMSNLRAQEAVKEEKSTSVKYGLKTGANYFTHYGDDVDDSDYNLGYNAGLYVKIPIGQHFAIQPELYYSRVGGRNVEYNYNTVPGSFATTRTVSENRLDYITLPIMFKFYPTNGGFNIEAGPQLGYNIYAKNATKTNVNTLAGNHEVEIKTDLDDQIKSLDFGVNFGLGYEFKGTGVNVGARYYWGLSNIMEDDTDLDVKNSGFSIAVGYSF